MDTPNEIVWGHVSRCAFAPARTRSHAESAVAEYPRDVSEVATSLRFGVPIVPIAPIGPNLSADLEWTSGETDHTSPMRAPHPAPAENQFLRGCPRKRLT